MVDKNPYSEILSNRFGVKIGKVDETFFSTVSVDEGIDLFTEEDFELIVARIDYSRTDLINQLEQRGFVLKDFQCTLRNPFKDRHGNLVFDKTERDDGYILREFKETDTDQIIDITRSSFANYGHYAANKGLSPEDSLDMYVDWAHNCCIDKEVATKIFVAEKGQDVAAYIAYKKFVDGDKTYAAGVIGAVNPKHRRKGLFPDVDIAALEWGIEKKFDWEEHNVLMDNFAVMKSHMSVGFRPQRSMVTLHGWVGELS